MIFDHVTDSKMLVDQPPHVSEEAGYDSAEFIRSNPKNPDLMLTDQQIGRLANKLGGEWEQLAASLELTPNDVYKFKMENQYNLWAQINAMLIKWRNREYKKATIGVLVERCKQCGIGREAYEFLMNV